MLNIKNKQTFFIIIVMNLLIIQLLPLNIKFVIPQDKELIDSKSVKEYNRVYKAFDSLFSSSTNFVNG